MSSIDPIPYLRRLLAAGSHNDVVQMIRDRDYAIAEWGSVFSRPEQLDGSDLVRFLHFEHNRHWWGLQGRAETLTASIELIRTLIGELLDPAVSVEDRIDGLGGPLAFDHHVWSPILLVTNPDRYGVWNGISEAAMRRLGLWPGGAESGSTGRRYVAVNEVLLLVRDELETDLWTLDALWWAAEKEHDPTRHFVTRKRPATVSRPRPSPATRTRTLRATKVKETVETFVCTACWTTKPARLRSASGDICVDCA